MMKVSSSRAIIQMKARTKARSGEMRSRHFLAQSNPPSLADSNTCARDRRSLFGALSQAIRTCKNRRVVTETASERAAAMRLAAKSDISSAIGILRPLVQASDDPEDRMLLGRVVYLATDLPQAQEQLERAYQDFQSRGLPRRAAVAATALGRLHPPPGVALEIHVSKSVLLLAMLLTGCAYVPSTSGVPASPTDAPRMVSPSPAASCRLPVLLPPDGTQPSTFKGTFAALPGGAFTPNPGAVFIAEQGGNRFRTADQPYLHGTTPGWYQESLGRWLPARQEHISPDGRAYVYSVPGEQKVRLVDVATGAERSFPYPQQAIFFAPLAYTQVGIFLAIRWEGLSPGLWRLDPDSGQWSKVSDKTVLAVSSDSIWLGEVNPADPKPFISALGDGKLSSQLSRSRLDGSQVQPWLYRPGSNIGILGFAATSRPIVIVGSPNASPSAFLLTAPEQATQIPWPTLSPGESGIPGLNTAVGDRDVVYFGGNAIWSFQAQTGLKAVVAIRGYPAGFCR